jgi:hypothetical protein
MIIKQLLTAVQPTCVTGTAPDDYPDTYKAARIHQQESNRPYHAGTKNGHADKIKCIGANQLNATRHTLNLFNHSHDTIVWL